MLEGSDIMFITYVNSLNYTLTRLSYLLHFNLTKSQ